MNTRTLARWALFAGLMTALNLASANSTTGAGCPAPSEITPAHLYGEWTLRLWPLGGRESAPSSVGRLVFERHPEFPGSVRGQLSRSIEGGQEAQALVSGDATDDGFSLDESADGVTIDAVWDGDLPASGCGREIRGVRSPAESGAQHDQPILNFQLKKSPGWR